MQGILDGLKILQNIRQSLITDSNISSVDHQRLIFSLSLRYTNNGASGLLFYAQSADLVCTESALAGLDR